MWYTYSAKKSQATKFQNTKKNESSRKIKTTLNGEEMEIKVTAIAKDGACMFTSLAHQLFYHKNGTDELKHASDELREKVVAYIQDNMEIFTRSLDSRIFEDHGKYPDDMVKARSDLINRLKIRSTWGDYESLYATALMYKVNIIVFTENGSCHPIGGFNLNNTRCALIAYRDANHYDSITNMPINAINQTSLLISRILDNQTKTNVQL